MYVVGRTRYIVQHQPEIPKYTSNTPAWESIQKHYDGILKSLHTKYQSYTAVIENTIQQTEQIVTQTIQTPVTGILSQDATNTPEKEHPLSEPAFIPVKTGEKPVSIPSFARPTYSSKHKHSISRIKTDKCTPVSLPPPLRSTHLHEQRRLCGGRKAMDMNAYMKALGYGHYGPTSSASAANRFYAPFSKHHTLTKIPLFHDARVLLQGNKHTQAGLAMMTNEFLHIFLSKIVYIDSLANIQLRSWNTVFSRQTAQHKSVPTHPNEHVQVLYTMKQLRRFHKKLHQKTKATKRVLQQQLSLCQEHNLQVQPYLEKIQSIFHRYTEYTNVIFPSYLQKYVSKSQEK